MNNNEVQHKLLQLLIVGYSGIDIPQNIKSLISNGLGGIIFFAENLKCRSDFKQKITNLKKLTKDNKYINPKSRKVLKYLNIVLENEHQVIDARYIAFKNGDNVGALYNSDGLIQFHQLKTGLYNVEKILSSYQADALKGKKNSISKTLDYIINNFRRKMIIFVIEIINHLDLLLL